MRKKYLFNRYKWDYTSWRWLKSPTTPKRVRFERKWPLITGAVVPQRCVVAESYDASVIVPSPIFSAFAVSLPGKARPPHVTITYGPYVASVALGIHSRFPLVGYHCRPVKRRKKRQRNPFWTRRNIRINGANWFYFRNGMFPDWDVLNRHPNETDIANGAPLPSTLWPVPLGF